MGICLCQVAHACCSVLSTLLDLSDLRDSSLRIICVFGQILQQFKKGWRLADEQQSRAEAHLRTKKLAIAKAAKCHEVIPEL